MNGSDAILLEEIEIDLAPDAVVLLDALAHVDWYVSGGELTWRISSWTDAKGCKFYDWAEKELARQLGDYVFLYQRNYIERELIERNGIVLGDANAEHRHSQREFV